MRNKRISSDSSSDDLPLSKMTSIDSESEDEIPLKLFRSNGYVEHPNSYKSLCRHSIEPCEFCDTISKNKYSSLIHNATHIIIPLLNQSVVQCEICLHHFTSENDLTSHKIKKHANLKLMIPEIKIVKIQTEELINKIRQPQYSLDNNKKTNELRIQEPDSKIEIKKEEMSPVVMKEVVRKEVVPIEVVLNEVVPKEVEPKVVESIKNRLVFEDEDDDLIFLDSNLVLSNFTTDCKVNLDALPPLFNDEEFQGKSVHYDKLVKPGVYRCKKCSKRFPVRYDAIIHESSHLKLRNTQVTKCIICKQFMLGDQNDLRLHYIRYHQQKGKQSPFYETENALRKKILFQSDIPQVFDEKRIFDSKILSLCELCFSFCKNKNTLNYEYLRTVSEIGKRYRCEKCGSKFFDIKLVRRDVQRRVGMFNKKRYTTKEDRLKIIAKRIKMLSNH